MRSRSPLVVAVLVIAGVLLLSLFFRSETPRTGFEPLDDVLAQIPAPPQRTGTSQVTAQTPLTEFVQFVFDDSQQVWAQQFQEAGRPFSPAELVLHAGAVESACGVAEQGTGPFYCPEDATIYIDLPFMESLAAFGAPGDMAQAYVVAHEMAHHVQRELGILGQVQQAQAENPGIANQLNVRLELQADCLAGVWAHTTRVRGLLEPGDIEEGLNAAASVGDDRTQAQTTGQINPDLFTHGTSEQRQSWFLRGFETGDPNACDTFSVGV